MLKQLSDDQRNLADFMSELSEHAYCAGWMKGLEYSLWTSLSFNKYSYGHYKLNKLEIAKLKELSHKCKGWIYFDQKNEESYIPLKQWVKMYKENKNDFSLT
jgi:hypothetical protein